MERPAARLAEIAPPGPASKDQTMSCDSAVGRSTRVTTMLSSLLTVPMTPPTNPPSRLLDCCVGTRLAACGALGTRSEHPTARALSNNAALATPRRRFLIENLQNAPGDAPRAA